MTATAATLSATWAATTNNLQPKTHLTTYHKLILAVDRAVIPAWLADRIQFATRRAP